MKHLTPFKIFENLESNQVSINEFLAGIGIDNGKIPEILDWWGKNRNDIKIHFFPFKTRQPIAGCFMGVDKICINQNLFMPSHIKLFLALHESRHCDQHREGVFEAGYWEPVVQGRKGDFLREYRNLERDANDFAVNSMREIGFEREMNMEEGRLRSNEGAGEMVYRMMTDDIQRTGATNFFDLLKKQIGV